jgi:hypothetical protein
MSRKPSKFSQSDVTRALKGAVGAGIAVSRVEIDKEGTIVIIAKLDDSTNSDATNPWNEVLTHAADEKRAA